MSGERRHADGPHTDVLVSLHEMLQAGNGGELKLGLPRPPPLLRAFLLPRLGADLLHGQRQAVAVAQADGAGPEQGRGAGGGLLGVGGAAAAGLRGGFLVSASGRGQCLFQRGGEESGELRERRRRRWRRRSRGRECQGWGR